MTFPFWPTLLVVMMALSYVKGCSDEKERFESYKEAVEAVGRVAEQRAKEETARRGALTKEKDDAWKKRIAELDRDNADLHDRLRTDTSRGVLPTVSGAAEGGSGANLLCFERDKLERGVGAALDGLLAGSTEILRRGDRRAAALAACGSWAIEQWKLDRGLPQR